MSVHVDKHSTLCFKCRINRKHWLESRTFCLLITLSKVADPFLCPFSTDVASALTSFKPAVRQYPSTWAKVNFNGFFLVTKIFRNIPPITVLLFNPFAPLASSLLQCSKLPAEAPNFSTRLGLLHAPSGHSKSRWDGQHAYCGIDTTEDLWTSFHSVCTTLKMWSHWSTTSRTRSCPSAMMLWPLLEDFWPSSLNLAEVFVLLCAWHGGYPSG